MNNYSLHFITDDRASNDLLDLISEAVAGGVTSVQLRNKKASKLELYEVGKKILKLLKPKKIPLIINDYVDLAQALDADGVHIGQTDLPYSAVRTILSKNKIVGLSLHTLEQAEKCGKYDVDYFGVGPVFRSRTKPHADPIGLEILFKITQLVSKPCIAIGGIEIENASSVLSHGAKGIAVVSGICTSSNPQLTAKYYVNALTHE